MRVLVACEYSGSVRDAFIRKGHDAISCDLLPTEVPGPHIQGDVLEVIDGGGYDMMIAHPPCTHLAVSGAAWFKGKRVKQMSAIGFFMFLANANFPRVCVENPVCIMSTLWRKPDQIIQPYQFGDSFQKTTCLWLKGLPKLIPSCYEAELFGMTVNKGEFVTYASGVKMPKWYAESWGDGHARSKTFPGIANAMANQWG